MKYTTYLKKSGLTNNEVIELLKPHFPKFSKIQCSMLSHPEEYGVQLTAQAKKLLPALPKTPRTAKPKAVNTDIVHCKDCKMYVDFGNGLGKGCVKNAEYGDPFKTNQYEWYGFIDHTKPDDYCSVGERKCNEGNS